MTDISNIAIERRAKENFQRANLKDRTWGDQMVEREPGKKISVALSGHLPSEVGSLALSYFEAMVLEAKDLQCDPKTRSTSMAN
jgi:hypothetical protein